MDWALQQLELLIEIRDILRGQAATSAVISKAEIFNASSTERELQQFEVSLKDDGAAFERAVSARVVYAQYIIYTVNGKHIYQGVV